MAGHGGAPWIERPSRNHHTVLTITKASPKRVLVLLEPKKVEKHDQFFCSGFLHRTGAPPTHTLSNSFRRHWSYAQFWTHVLVTSSMLLAVCIGCFSANKYSTKSPWIPTKNTSWHCAVYLGPLTVSLMCQIGAHTVFQTFTLSTIGNRAFLVAAAKICNALPNNVDSSSTMTLSNTHYRRPFCFSDLFC